MTFRGRQTVINIKGKQANLLIIPVLAIGLLAVAGCGRVEINDRSIVLGVAIDKPLSPEAKQKNEQQQSGSQPGGQQADPGTQGQPQGDFLRIEPPPEDQTPRYAMTVETPIVAQLGGVSEGGGGGPGGGGQGAGKTWVLTATGNTIWDIERSLSLRVSRQDFYGHLKVIIISDEVAREGIYPVIEFFTRRREVQQGITLAISNGEARKVLQVIPLEESFASFYLESILQQLFRTGSKINLNMLEARKFLEESGNTVLPRVRASSPTEIVAGGAAVIKDWKFIGWLSELETSGYNIVQGNIVGGGLPVVDPKDSSNLIFLVVRGLKVKRSVELVNNKPVFTVKVKSEFDVIEKGSQTSLWDTAYLHQIEHRAAREIQRRGLTVIDKMQREYQADVFGFGGMLNKYYPKYWKIVKGKWDEKYFPEAKVNIDVTSQVRRTGEKT